MVSTFLAVEFFYGQVHGETYTHCGYQLKSLLVGRFCGFRQGDHDIFAAPRRSCSRAVSSMVAWACFALVMRLEGRRLLGMDSLRVRS